MTGRIVAIYHVRCDTTTVAARAQAIAVEQSVEMPLEAIDEPAVLCDIVGEVQSIDVVGDGVFAVRIGLASETVYDDPGQLLNMLFGNTSLHDDAVLHDVEFTHDSTMKFAGPGHGTAGLRSRVNARQRALTCSALKPQGLSPVQLAMLAEQFARGGIDFIKDDHGLADQRYSPFVERVARCAEAVARAANATGHPTRYVPSLSGHLDSMRSQVNLARAAGLDTVLLAPMIAGFANVQALVHEFSDMAFFAHPALGGAARIAPELLIGRLFRLIGADAVIFPNHGGRFGYSRDTCGRLADNARQPWQDKRASLPVPAGGMTLERTPEILDFYGPDVMLLIGGNLLLARERLTDATATFTRAVAEHRYG